MYITKFIKKLKKNKPLLFTTPGHAQGFYSADEFRKTFGKKVFSGDFSEIEGIDNLQAPQGIIKDSQGWAARIYGSKETFYLVNGSSSGIIALILAIVRKGQKILIARNAHKSVVNALVLSGAIPVWVEPEWNEQWNIPVAIASEKIAKALEENPDIKAVLITSPTYEGVITDIKSIAEICHKKNIPMIVDEAHGALWNFSERLPIISTHLGADANVQSLHKTGSCLNQGALLHISKNSLISSEKLQQTLNLINTTSPSYLLLASIESSIEYLNSKKGREKLDKLLDNIEEAKKNLSINNGVNFLECNDPTKIVFKLSNVSGQELSDFLEDRFNIEVELNNDRALLALTGIGTDKEMLKKLTYALEIAAKELKNINGVKCASCSYTYEQDEGSSPFNAFTRKKKSLEPQNKVSPAEAFYSDSETVLLSESVGRICAEIIVTYPPGIPLIIPGEVIQSEHINVIKDKKWIRVLTG